MALTAEEQKFYDFAKAALPPWIPDGDEFLMGAAKMFGGVKTLFDYLFGQALIGGATGPTATTPDWLDQHARDRGTSRQLTETDAALQERLRNAPDALTRIAILAALDAVLEAEGVTDTAALVELPAHMAHGGAYVSDTGTGGTFTKSGTTMTFEPDTSWARPPFWDPDIVPARSTQLVINGAADATNDGTHTITELEDDAAVYTDADGVAGADAGCTWSVQVLDGEGNVRDGFSRAFSQRGYRSARVPMPRILLVILPFGTTAATEASVREALRQKKAAGIALLVERRTIAP
jgi:hypothetical protein